MIAPVRLNRALNQKTACHLPFADFLDLAQRLGCIGVEPRNDLGRPFFDGIAPEEVAAMAEDRGLRLLGLSEVYAFNVWDDERAAAVRGLVETAGAAGAETISLIPCVDERSPQPAVRDQVLREVIERIGAVLEGSGVIGLIEPIGFESSSLRHKAQLVAAIDAAGAGHFKLVHDTFQHCIAGETEIYPEHTAIIHISGISNPDVTLDAGQDAHRVLIDARDRCENVKQIRAFLAAGYDGAFSFECTAPPVQDSSALEDDLRRSFEYVEMALAG